MNSQIPIYLAMTRKQILILSLCTYNSCYRPLQQDHLNVFVLDLVMSEVNSDAFFVFTDLFWTLLCSTVIDHITYEVLNPLHKITAHFTATHSKDKNERCSKPKEQRVKCNLFNRVWIEVCMTANGEGVNEG